MSAAVWDERIPEAVEKIGPSVVSVTADRSVRAGASRTAFTVEGGGSGVAISADGLVVTNHHVVDSARRLRVTFSDGTRRPAGLLGADESTDIAVLRVDGVNGIVPASLGDSERLRVGQLALAVGHSLALPGGPTVSVGVVSALGRPMPGSDFVWEGLLQTDAAINPGNSGGPLADIEGRVVGLNTMMIPYAQGVGFAIPVNTVKTVIESLRRRGRVVRPWLGISGAAVTPQIRRRLDLDAEEGVLVAEVVPASPADEAGLKPGDILVGVEARPLARLRDLLRELAAFRIGDRVVLTFRRDGQPHRTALRLAEDPRERWNGSERATASER
jgi:serine protease Do